MRHKRHKEPSTIHVEKLMIDMRHARRSLLEMHHHLTPYKNEYFDTCSKVIEDIDQLGAVFGFPPDHFHTRSNSSKSLASDA